MKNQPGFTLVELMIVCAVLGIVAMVAIPAYTEQVARGKRAEAKAALLRGAQQMERYYTVNNCYPSSAATCGPATTSAAALTAADIRAWSGDNASHSKYNISVTTTAQDFTLTATPISATVDPKCNILTITNTGAKDISGGAAGATKADCWAR
jgi:type IV pilus assembly protein PilE